MEHLLPTHHSLEVPVAKVVVLGGCGGIGRVAVRALATLDWVGELVVADVRGEDAAVFAASLGKGHIRAAEFDATNPESTRAVLAGARVVLNCVGPFYRFGPPILRAAIDAGVDYVDVCDDLAPTRQMLELHEEAKAKGISCLVGMGNSPGLANVFVALCRDLLLDQVEEVDSLHIHGGEAEEGPAVIKHRIHAMVNDVPLFIDGRFIEVRQLEESGAKYTVETDFRNVGRYPVYPYPHPETITLPRHIPGLRRATNLGVIFPLSYFQLTQEMVRVGACTEAPLKVGDQTIVPLEFSVAHILSRRAELLAAAGVSGPGGCLKVVVAGQKAGKREVYTLSVSSRSAGAGEGTGIPAAAGAALMARGQITTKGVFPPEAGPNPLAVLSTALELSRSLGAIGGDTIHVERTDASGTTKPVELPF